MADLQGDIFGQGSAGSSDSSSAISFDSTTANLANFDYNGVHVFGGYTAAVGDIGGTATDGILTAPDNFTSTFSASTTSSAQMQAPINTAGTTSQDYLTVSPFPLVSGRTLTSVTKNGHRRTILSSNSQGISVGFDHRLRVEVGLIGTDGVLRPLGTEYDTGTLSYSGAINNGATFLGGLTQDVNLSFTGSLTVNAGDKLYVRVRKDINMTTTAAFPYFINFNTLLGTNEGFFANFS